MSQNTASVNLQDYICKDLKSNEKYHPRSIFLCQSNFFIKWENQLIFIFPVEPIVKTTRKSGKTLKPSKPSDIDCDKDHKVIVQDDKNINGVLVVKQCHATRFNRKHSRCTNVGNKFGSLLNTRLDKLGIKDKFDVKIVKTVGDKKQTEFHYTVSCDKSHHKTVIDSLKDACKDKTLKDTVTNENQPDDDDSSSESSEEFTRRATPQTKPTVPTKPQTGKSIILLFIFYFSKRDKQYTMRKFLLDFVYSRSSEILPFHMTHFLETDP
jgi:hypothetical protein